MTTWTQKIFGASLALFTLSGHAEEGKGKHLRKELREARKPCVKAAQEACKKDDHDCIKKFKLENEACKELREVRGEIHDKRKQLKKEWKEHQKKETEKK